MGNIIQTGNIPATAKIELESCTDQWRLFSKGLLKNFSTSGIIVLDEEGGKKAKVSIVMLHIDSPETFVSQTVTQGCAIGGEVEETEARGYLRARELFSKEVDKKTWFFKAYINGKKKIPIVIIHYEIFNFTVYSAITDENEVRRLFPLGMDSGMN